MKRGSRLDELFTLLFMILAVGVVVCFFVLGSNNPTYLILGGIAVLLRVAQYIMRFF
ncbi:MAG: hypothetical protein LBL33_07260 [Tannerella sp.]|jgi:hypothetical protein|nr:hypothetical protein [Tannerella sp.]